MVQMCILSSYKECMLSILSSIVVLLKRHYYIITVDPGYQKCVEPANESLTLPAAVDLKVHCE